MLPEKICIVPWISIEASPIGTARPCCLAKDEITYEDESGKVQKYNLNTHTPEEIYHSRYMQLLRRDFLYGKQPETCRRCWDEEAAGRTSKRMNSQLRLNQYYDDVDWHNLNPDQLWFIDLKLGNICNLKCRICGSWSSSKWAKEEMDYMPFIDRKKHFAYKFMQAGAWPRESPVFWDNMKELLPNIKYFEFTGGEPFLIQQHFDLLQYAVDNGYSQNIEIHYNTNGTVYPEAAELWSHFKNVEIAVSIDNVGERFEFERYGAKWDEVMTNIQLFNKLKSDMASGHMTIQLCTTINVQNVYYLPEMCDWISTQTFDNVYFNMLHDPWFMGIAHLTAAAKQVVIDRLSNHKFQEEYQTEIMHVIKFIENGKGSDGKEFIRRMKQTDEYREQSFLDTHRDIARAMGYEQT